MSCSPVQVHPCFGRIQSQSPGAGTIGLFVAAVQSGPNWTPLYQKSIIVSSDISVSLKNMKNAIELRGRVFSDGNWSGYEPHSGEP
jgi:hypothetical protein